jgi:hypothetical protein
MIVPMKELSGKEAFDPTGFRRMPQHSPPDALLFPEPSRGRLPTRKPRSALPSALTPALIRSPAEWRPVEIGPSASSISPPGAGANVCRKARLPRSSIPNFVPLPLYGDTGGIAEHYLESQRSARSCAETRPPPRPSGSHSTNFRLMPGNTGHSRRIWVGST